jgi:hypothetical protein
MFRMQAYPLYNTAKLSQVMKKLHGYGQHSSPQHQMNMSGHLHAQQPLPFHEDSRIRSLFSSTSLSEL